VPRSVSVILSLPPHFSLCGSSRSAAQQVWYGQLAAYSFKASYFNLLSYVVTIAFSVLHVTFYAAYSLFLFLFPCHWCAIVMSSLVNAFDLVDPDCARLIPFAVRPSPSKSLHVCELKTMLSQYHRQGHHAHLFTLFLSPPKRRSLRCRHFWVRG